MVGRSVATYDQRGLLDGLRTPLRLAQTRKAVLTAALHVPDTRGMAEAVEITGLLRPYISYISSLKDRYKGGGGYVMAQGTRAWWPCRGMRGEGCKHVRTQQACGFSPYNAYRSA